MERVLQVFSCLDRGGAETLIMNIYREIDKTKVQFDFVVHTEKEQAYAKEILDMGGKIYYCPRYKVVNHFKYVKWWKEFFKEHPEYKVVHGHMYSTAAIYLKVARKFNKIAIAHSHSTSSGKGFSARVKDFIQYFLRFNADYFFGCSKEAGEWLFGKKVVQSNKYFMLNNAINLQNFIFTQDYREEIRKEFNVSENKKIIGHVGRFCEPKNHDFLIEIFSEIHKKDQDAILMLVGDGELREQIEQKVKEYNLSDCVIFTGVRSDVNKMLSAFDLFLFPSWFEGLPVTVVEAQANGLPCILSDTITKDVNLSELVDYFPLNKSAEDWANFSLGKVCKRVDVLNKIQQAGFDIQTTTNWLQEFYLADNVN